MKINILLLLLLALSSIATATIDLEILSKMSPDELNKLPQDVRDGLKYGLLLKIMLSNTLFSIQVG
jgi:hypothetical protein